MCFLLLKCADRLHAYAILRFSIILDINSLDIFYRIMRDFHRTFSTGFACRRGEAYSSEHIAPSCFGLAYMYVLLVDINSFLELVVIFPDYALRTSLATTLILLISLSHVVRTRIICVTPCYTLYMKWKNKHSNFVLTLKLIWTDVNCHRTYFYWTFI